MAVAVLGCGKAELRRCRVFETRDVVLDRDGEKLCMGKHTPIAVRGSALSGMVGLGSLVRIAVEEAQHQLNCVRLIARILGGCRCAVAGLKINDASLTFLESVLATSLEDSGLAYRRNTQRERERLRLYLQEQSDYVSQLEG